MFLYRRLTTFLFLLVHIALLIVPVAVEVGVAASPLGPDTILISYKVEGDEKLENVELFYVQEGGTQWTQLYQDVIAFHGVRKRN